MKFAIIDYGMGNLRSVCKAWEHVGATVELVDDPAKIDGADALIFPGQGAIVDTMRLLNETGFANAIREWIAADKPFFGICLGLQALFEHSEEGDADCLGVFKGQVKRFQVPAGLKIPHMGWNAVKLVKPTGMATQVQDGDQFYFVHSYHIVPEDSDIVWMTTDYGSPFASAIARGNCFATQFHPEKSQQCGLRLYQDFVEHVAKL